MTRRFGLAVCLALVLTKIAIPASAGPAGGESAALSGLVAEIIAEGGYQVSVDATPPERPLLRLPAWMAAPLQVLMWVLLLILAAIAVLFLISMFRQRVPPPEDEAEAGLPREGDPAWAEVGLRNADELAREGRIAEALHALLLAALGELRRRGGVEIRDSLTSREILARVSLPAGSEAPLSDLVREVEFAFFGGHDRSPEDYRRGRERFERLRLAMTGGAA